MKTVRRLIYREVVISIVLVTLGFLSLFFFVLRSSMEIAR